MTKTQPPLDCLVLGGGLSGLACAQTLHRAGKSVLVIERASEPGGRVRSRQTSEGFVIDEGFQVLLNSYPELVRFLDLKQLQLRPFNSGALIYGGKKLKLLANPLAHPETVWRSLGQNFVTLKDKILVAKLMWQAQRYRSDDELGEQTTLVYLKQFGFSEQFIEYFWRPFFTGVYLDPELSLGHKYFLFLVRCFGLGQVSLPAQGMGAIGRQMAQALPSSAIRFGTQVKAWSAGRVELESGEILVAKQVVCAFDPSAQMPSLPALEYRSVTTSYFTSPELEESNTNNINWGRWLILVPRHLGYSINHMILLSQVAKEYARDKALLSVSVVGSKPDDPERLMSEIQSVAGRKLQLRRIAVTKVDQALPVLASETEGFKVIDGVIYCGDRWASPSINGALRSGRLAAEFVAGLKLAPLTVSAHSDPPYCFSRLS